MGRTVVAGFDNVLMSDDGIGIQVVRGLAAHALPDWVELEMGLELSPPAAVAARREAGLILAEVRGGADA